MSRAGPSRIESVIRLVGALLVEMNDEQGADDRRYIAAGSVAALLDGTDRLPSLPEAPQPIARPTPHRGT